MFGKEANSLKFIAINFYTHDTEKDPYVNNVQSKEYYRYETVNIESDNFNNDFIELMYIHTGIKIDGLWYEGDKLCVDLNKERTWQTFDNGSTGGMIYRQKLLFTLSSFPNIEQIEVLVGGLKGVAGSHFNFIPVFDVNEFN